MILSGIWRRRDGSHESAPESIVVKLDKDISPYDIQDLCCAVGWSKRDPGLISRALKNSLVVVSAWDGEVLVGFARATGDQVFNATIWDVAVRPGYQRKNIGRLIMSMLLKELDNYSIPLITLYADPGRDNFYRQFGFFIDPSGVRGMFREKL